MFTITVKETQKALLYKNEKLVDVLGAGIHKWYPAFMHYTWELYDFRLKGIGGSKAKMLCMMHPALVEKHFTVVRLEAHERAYVYIDGEFTELLKAGTTKLYWKEYAVRTEIVDVRKEYVVAQAHMHYLDSLDSDEKVTVCGVDKNAQGHLFVNERFTQKVDAGKYAYYTDFYDIDLKTVDLRVKELEITGQELLSADKVTLRCNATMHYRIVDGQKYFTAVEAPEVYLYKQLQFAIREHIGRLDVDAVVTRQHALADEIVEKFVHLCETIGIRVETVHLKDIILPGEMREIFNQVIEATKRAEANNIQRREETAATRSLLNTAKLMHDNPALVRLKELEALEKITGTVGSLNVYGGLEHVMNGLVHLNVR